MENKLREVVEKFDENFRYTLVYSIKLNMLEIWPMSDGLPINKPKLFKEIYNGLQKEWERVSDKPLNWNVKVPYIFEIEYE